MDRGVLREDRDALLALEVAAVHRAFLDMLVRAERSALPQHLVDKGGLAVVDVGDDGDITHVGAPHLGGRKLGGLRRHKGQSRSTSWGCRPPSDHLPTTRDAGRGSRSGG
jgi:hypothetical protein